MPTCVTRNAGGERCLTVFACPSHPLSWSLVNPSHWKATLATFSVAVSNPLGWGTDLSLVMGIFTNRFLNALVFVAGRCGTTGSGHGTVLRTSRQRRCDAEQSGHDVDPCTASL